MQGLLRPARLVLLPLLLAVAPAGALDLGSTNLNRIGNFWSAAEARQRPVVVLAFGDSMADSYRSATFHLMRQLEDRLGVVGYAMNNYRNTAMFALTNGAAFVPASPIWFAHHYQLPPTGGVGWENQAAPGGIFCDQVGVYYVAQPQGGVMTFSVSTNRGDWTVLLTLNGYSASPVGGFTNITLAPNRHRIRVDSISGTNFVIGPHFLQGHTNGLQMVFGDGWGLALGQVANVPLSIRQPIYEALQPDLIVWHMKEGIDTANSNNFNACELWWSNSCPRAEVVYLGTPYGYWDVSNSLTTDHNRLVRNIAVRHNRAYVDLMQAGISFDWLNTNGLMFTDGVHLSYAGGQWAANVIWRELGFYALGLPRRLSLQATGTVAHLAFLTAPGANYHLERSTNLRDWWGLSTNAGNGSTYVTNLLQTTGNEFFRLRLQPP